MLFCAAFPVIYAVLTIINQGHRFDVVEGIGCQPVIYLNPLAVIIDYGIPLSISVLSMIYSCMSSTC